MNCVGAEEEDLCHFSFFIFLPLYSLKCWSLSIFFFSYWVFCDSSEEFAKLDIRFLVFILFFFLNSIYIYTQDMLQP